MLSGSSNSSNLGKYTVIIDGTNFMVASESSLGVRTTIWPGFTFSENDVFDGFTYVIQWDFAMVSLIVEPAQ